VGLVQRKIEAAGFSTVIISTIPNLTTSVGVPRLVAVEHPQGRTMGSPGDRVRQLAVLRAAVQALKEMKAPGGIKHLPFEWGESPVKARSPAIPPPPIAQYLQRHPWLLLKLLNRDIPETLDNDQKQ